MRSIVKQSQKRLRKVQESDKGWQLCKSRAKVKPGGAQEQLDDIEIDLQNREQSSLGFKIFNKNQDITEGFFQSLSIAQQLQDDNLPDDLPFYCQGMGFMDYLEMEYSQIMKAEKMMTELQGEIQQLAHSINTNNNLSNPEKIQTEFEITTKKNQSLFQFISSAIKLDDQQLEKLFDEELQTLTKLNQVLQEEKMYHTEMKIIEEKLSIKQSQFQSKFILWQKAKNNLLLNQFQTSIIKLQKGCTMYLYGAKVIKSEVSRNEYFDKRCYKFDYKVKPIDMIDLKVFVLTTLFPMSMRIFEDFSSSSSIYKVMFGLDNLLSQQQRVPSIMTLNKRIQKHLIQKKYNSMQQCLNLTVRLRKKMIIFIGMKQSFEELTNQLLNQLNGFNSKFMQITKLSLTQISDSYDSTSFTHYHLQISFFYNQINMKSSIDILFCVPYVVSRVQIEELKKKSGRTDSVLVWFEIPKADYDQERMQTYKEINYMLSNCQKFYISAVKKYNTKLVK